MSTIATWDTVSTNSYATQVAFSWIRMNVRRVRIKPKFLPNQKFCRDAMGLQAPPLVPLVNRKIVSWLTAMFFPGNAPLVDVANPPASWSICDVGKNGCSKVAGNDGSNNQERSEAIRTRVGG